MRQRGHAAAAGRRSNGGTPVAARVAVAFARGLVGIVAAVVADPGARPTRRAGR